MQLAFYFLRKGKFKSFYNFIWVHAFTRDSGLALLDPLFRVFPFLAPYPQTIEMEITTRCHLKCTMCEHTYWKEPARDMTLDEFKRIINQFPKLKWLGITGIGSNFLNKDFIAMLEYSKKRSAYVEFFDTFDLLDEARAEKLVKMGLDKIWMSIDGATPETYNKIRVGTDFNKVIGNLKKLIEIKKKYKTPFPEIYFHYIVSKDNYKELPAFVKLVGSIKKNDTNPEVLVYFSNLLDFAEVSSMKAELPEEIKKETEKAASDLGIYLGWNPNLAPTRPVRECVRWTEPFILVTGHVQPCCAINEANTRQHQKDHSMGNLLETDFRNLWYNGFKHLKKEVHSGRFIDICKYCRNYVRK